MKTIFTKSTGNVIGNVKKVLTLSAVAAIAAVPFVGVTQTAQADPPRHGWKKHDRDRGRYDRRDDRWDRRNDRRNDRRDYASYTGTVTKVHNSRQFDLRANGRTYNVHLNSSERRIDRGDIVRVYGERKYNNDIRNASASIIRNR